MEITIQFQRRKAGLIQIPPVETRAFNEHIKKVVVEVDDLVEEEEPKDSESKELAVMDVELEEEREKMRREEEVHPNEVKDQVLNDVS